jgi:hypothetical protein
MSYASVAPDMGTIAVALSAVVLAVRDDEPVVAMVASAGGHAPEPVALPGGLFCAGEHDSLDAGLVACVERQTGLSLRQTRQISTASARASMASLVLSISYLALLGPEPCRNAAASPGAAGITIFRGKIGGTDVPPV